MFSLFRRKKKPAAEMIADITNGPGTYSIDVVGESHYQRALSKVCGGHSKDGHRLKVEAFLVPEDTNPYDKKAVMVVIERETVGYLDRETARSFRKELAKIAPPGTIAKCQGMVVGGWDDGMGDKGHFGVKLDLPTG